MVRLSFEDVKTVLCLGAHADDIEIGCGGTLLRLLAEHDVKVVWVVFSADQQRKEEAIRSANLFLENAVESEIIVEQFRDAFFPYQGEEIKQRFRELRESVSPDIIFTHRREDAHQDHRVLADLTWNTFRSHLILEYEIPKYEGDLGTPNLYTPLTEQLCKTKVETTLESFGTQHSRPWFSADTFWSLLRLRGIECGSPTRFAEGLYCRKMAI